MPGGDPRRSAALSLPVMVQRQIVAIFTFTFTFTIFSGGHAGLPFRLR